MTESKLDNKCWHDEVGRLHRLDGPAVDHSSGYKAWYVHGRRHRTDGPAIKWPLYNREWWVDGERHRLDGPAIDWSNGDKQWWINNEQLTKEQFDEHPLVIFHRLSKETL